MDDLGAGLATISGLRVFPFWADRVTPPAAVVDWPEELTYDSAYGRGMDRLEIRVHVVVGKVDARTSRDVMAAYADGSGSGSVKSAIESYSATAYDTARVTRAEFGYMEIASVQYLAATFYVDVVGSGG